MSRKKVKKETVKRKTNIYDPMGVYGRGLTENQRLGMTTQMKVENIRNPEKSITRKDLEEYKKILEFYGMYKRIPAGHNGSVSIHLTFGVNNLTISKDYILNWLTNQMHIQPVFFICNSFRITNTRQTWDPDLFYEIIVGSSVIHVGTSPYEVSLPTNNSHVIIPSYFINGTRLNYFQLCYDDDQSDMFATQEINVLDPVTAVDFYSLPDDCSPIPYLIYPNSGIPELQVSVGFDYSKSFIYGLDINVFVIY